MENSTRPRQQPESDPRPRVAAVVTSYYPRSHADVIVSKLLADYTYPAPYDRERFDFHRWARALTEAPLPTDEQGRLRSPRVRVVSLYTDQVPENDLSREWSARTGVPIFPTVAGALTLGGEHLAVDGVLIVGEHGDYPHNERGQHMYPRRRLFEEAVAVFRASGRAVPVFVDKHLGYAWSDAKWMVDTAATLGFPLMAGSSVPTAPVSWRRPRIQLPLGSQIHRALVAAHPPFEAYGFHALEGLQCIVERRLPATPGRSDQWRDREPWSGAVAGNPGGESGVAAVQALTGEAMWQAVDEGGWSDLLDSALGVSERRVPGDPRTLAREPAIFLVDYRDGLRAAVCLLGGVTSQRAFAADVTLPGAAQPERFAFRFGEGGGEPYAHFAWLNEAIQDMICTGRAVQPIERTLLTTGVLDRVMESHWRGGIRRESPELAISYTVE